MAKLSDIYGTDTNDFAERCASTALSKGGDKMWQGGNQDSRAKSLGGDDRADDPVNKPDLQIGARDDGRKNDSRAVSRGGHAPTPDTMRKSRE